MEITEILRFVGALAFIIGLIAVCAFAAKRLGLATGGLTSMGGRKRLGVSEVKVIDAKHRLVLIRRDNKEHLILLGGDRDLLIESGIDAPVVEEQPVDANAAPVLQFPAPAAQFQKLFEFIKERRA
jgi:flagellar protein FliO/FliZ